MNNIYLPHHDKRLIAFTSLKFFVNLIDKALKFDVALDLLNPVLVKGDLSFICTILSFSGDFKKKRSTNSLIFLPSL